MQLRMANQFGGGVACTSSRKQCYLLCHFALTGNCGANIAVEPSKCYEHGGQEDVKHCRLPLKTEREWQSCRYSTNSTDTNNAFPVRRWAKWSPIWGNRIYGETRKLCLICQIVQQSGYKSTHPLKSHLFWTDLAASAGISISDVICMRMWHTSAYK